VPHPSGPAKQAHVPPCRNTQVTALQPWWSSWYYLEKSL
jgi:hypothetical protein